MRKKLMGFMLLSIVENASLAPLHSRKNFAVASRSSIRAKCTPIQTLEPALKGEKTAFAVGESLFGGSQRV
jgi:hypothetical protein